VAPARISGLVAFGSASDPTPAPGRTVSLFRASEYGTAAPAVATTTTAADGTYMLEDVDAPENYLIEVRSTPNGTVLVTSTPFAMSASEQKQVDLFISSG
jgi:hypothetical protein